MPRYAVNIADLDRKELRIAAAALIAPVIQSRQIVDAEPGYGDGQAVVLECPEVQAEAIMRLFCMKGQSTRFYRETNRGTWVKVARKAIEAVA